ncbi:MAG: pentapeptide repeat-containing protein [Nostoc sp.]|uniref:pentapeptide repeat-containing protein n=1 Tax=Nostoc sp. TaxID=1180 RepID=UPI002FFB6360
MVICNSYFYTLRFSSALINVLFTSTSFARVTAITSLIISIFAAISGALVAFFAAQANATELKEILPRLTYLEREHLNYIGVFSGICLITILILSSWWVNYYQNVPWRHPDLLRSWVIVVGSWRGTSFYNLDLSNINFKNTQLANTDLRARKLYRTCFQGVTGLERARVDSRYLDLEILKVQRLLTHACSKDSDFSNLNLRGAYLQDADLRRIKFIDTDLSGANLQGADLRGSIFANAQAIDVDFTNANLTAICIQDWNVNSQTCFTNVECDYIYRKLDNKGEPCDRHPLDRNFEPREFESLYQEVGNVVELVFKEGVNWRAFAFSLQKLELENESLGLELKGIEKKGDLWVAKVTHNENISHAEVEKRLNDSYEELKQRLSIKEQQINSLLGIASTQAETIKEFSKRPFGNSFVINGSTITNLTGSGQIEYNEAAEQVRSLVANGTEPVQVLNIVQHLLAQLQGQSVATTAGTQAELIKQLLLNEAEKDSVFKQLLVLQSQQIIDSLPEGAIATAMKQAIAQLQRSSTNS